MGLNETIFIILEDNALEGNSKLQPLIDAVKDRNLITFDYTGPRTGKNRVKQGYRVKAEGVAIGLTKKGNLALRAWVPEPNTSRKGFKPKKIKRKDGSIRIVPATHWRTFLIDRMKKLVVLRETFNTKREDYKDGDDGSFSVTYYKSDWNKEAVHVTPKVEKPTKIPKSRADLAKPPKPPKPKVVEPTPEVEPKKKPEELPQPKPEKKPEPIEKPIAEPKPEVKPEPIGKPLPEPQQKVEPKTKELPQPKPNTKPAANPEEDEENLKLQESILKIKRLMFS
jgi:hypothetical protein